MMHRIFKHTRLKIWLLSVLMLLTAVNTWARKDVIPDRPSPQRLVNDMADMLSSQEQEQLEHKLDGFDRTTSTQITVLTINSLDDYDVSDYAVQTFNKWGIGQKGKNNGVLLLISKGDRKAWITTGKGLEGVLTDAKTSRIFRNELRPAFKAGDYYTGINNTVDAIIAVTKDEYHGDKKGTGGSIPGAALIVVLIFIWIIIKIIGRGGGGGGGGYMSRRGMGNFATGWLIGNMLSGGNRGGWGNSGGSDWGGGSGGGFGGFGGGSSGGGGAGGSW